MSCAASTKPCAALPPAAKRSEPEHGLGKNATLGVFLDTYDVELTDDSIKFPEVNQLGGQSESLGRVVA